MRRARLLWIMEFSTLPDQQGRRARHSILPHVRVQRHGTLLVRRPGRSPETFWGLLRRGDNTASDVPADRWQSYAELGPRHASALRNTVRQGNFLNGIDGFDADFFGLSPREAELM